MGKQKQYHSGLLLISALLLGYGTITGWVESHTQQVPIAVVIKDGAEPGLSDKRSFLLKRDCVPGKEYQVTISFNIKDRQGNGLLGPMAPQEENPAMTGCGKAALTKNITARKERLAVWLDIKADPAQIRDGNGDLLDPEAQMLCPVIQIKERESGKEGRES